jgi:hypothetical protein
MDFTLSVTSEQCCIHISICVLNAGTLIKSSGLRSIDNFKSGKAVSKSGTLEGIIYFEA